MPRIWKPLPKEFPADGATVWVTPSNQYNPPFLATFELSTFQFTDVTSSAVMPWWAIARWKPASLAPSITDSFSGTGTLDTHLSNQGFPWLDISGSLSLDGSGLTTDSFSDGLYYLDDPAYGTTPPPRTDLQLNLPVVPTPNEGITIRLFALAEPVADVTSRNFLRLEIDWNSIDLWTWNTLSVDAAGGSDFQVGSFIGHPGIITILPATQEFGADGSPLGTAIANAPTWSTNSRPGINMSFVSPVDVHATMFGAPI